MDATLVIEEGPLYEFMDLLAKNVDPLPSGLPFPFYEASPTLLRGAQQYTPPPRDTLSTSYFLK